MGHFLRHRHRLIKRIKSLVFECTCKVDIAGLKLSLNITMKFFFWIEVIKSSEKYLMIVSIISLSKMPLLSGLKPCNYLYQYDTFATAI